MRRAHAGEEKNGIRDNFWNVPMRTSIELNRLFADLEARLTALDPKVSLGLKRDRWLLGTISAGLLMTLAGSSGWLNAYSGWLVALVGIVLEACGFALLTYRQVRDVAPDFVDAKKKFAKELDGHYAEYEALAASLRAIPTSERTKRAKYVESRLAAISQRYPLFFGPADKLGVLPALIGLFLQAQSLQSASILSLLLGVAVIALYLMGLWIARFRLQLQAYLRVLRFAEE